MFFFHCSSDASHSAPFKAGKLIFLAVALVAGEKH